MLIACALAETLHHSFGSKPSKYDTRVVVAAQHGAEAGRLPPGHRRRQTRSTSHLTTRKRLPLGCGRRTFGHRQDLQRSVVHVDAPSLDVPAPQMDDEVDAFLLAPLMVFQEQAIIQEIQEIPVPSSVVRGPQPTKAEEAPDVPVLHMNDNYFNVSRTLELLEKVTFQETPNVQVLHCVLSTRKSRRSLTKFPKYMSRRRLLCLHRGMPQFLQFSFQWSECSSAAISWLDAPHGFFFALFPSLQKVVRPAVECGTGVTLELIHTVSRGRSWARATPSGTRRGSAEPSLCWFGCTGSRASHPWPPPS